MHTQIGLRSIGVNGSPQLFEYPGDIVRLSCEKCERTADYFSHRALKFEGPHCFQRGPVEDSVIPAFLDRYCTICVPAVRGFSCVLRFPQCSLYQTP